MMTLVQIYESKSNESPKTEMINFCLNGLSEAEKTNDRWLSTGTKAPTRGTVINWLTGVTKPTNPLHIEELAVLFKTTPDKLF